MYPIPNREANLILINKFKEEYKITTGYSDHTVGTEAVEVAVALGAEIIEMHFTDKREGKTFRDQKVSFTADEIRELIKKIKVITTLHGEGNKQPTESELESNHVKSFRRAVYPIRDLKAGSVLHEGDLTVLRPNHGIDARDFYKILGKKLKKNIKKLQVLSWDYFE